MRYILLLSIILLFSCTSNKNEASSVFNQFASDFCNVPEKYESISTDTLTTMNLINSDSELFSRYINLDMAISRSIFDTDIKVNSNPDSILYWADSILRTGEEDLTWQPGIAGIEDMVMFTSSKRRLTSAFIDYRSCLENYKYDENCIIVKHKYRTLNDTGNLVLKESLITIDTVTQEIKKVIHL